MPIKFIKTLYRNDPALWRRAIDKLLDGDRRSPPPDNAVLFAGSSSIRFWETLAQDMAPLPVINRGFGGSMIHQVVHYMDRIILPYKPSAIFFYAGENDITGLLVTKKHSAEEVCRNFQEFCRKVHQELPDTSIHFISIKPPKLRKRYWPEMQRANTLIEKFCASDSRLHYIDIVPAMLDDAGETRFELFRRDGIHLNEDGYAVWTRVIRPIVEGVYAEGLARSPAPE